MSAVTEDVAKTKWCPMSRVSVAIGPAGDTELYNNRLEGTGERLNDPVCIGSACMMWRKQARTFDTEADAFVTSRDASLAVMAGAKAERFDMRWTDHGYCGLAGRPE